MLLFMVSYFAFPKGLSRTWEQLSIYLDIPLATL